MRMLSEVCLTAMNLKSCNGHHAGILPKRMSSMLSMGIVTKKIRKIPLKPVLGKGKHTINKELHHHLVKTELNSRVQCPLHVWNVSFLIVKPLFKKWEFRCYCSKIGVQMYYFACGIWYPKIYGTGCNTFRNILLGVSKYLECYFVCISLKVYQNTLEYACISLMVYQDI